MVAWLSESNERNATEAKAILSGALMLTREYGERDVFPEGVEERAPVTLVGRMLHYTPMRLAMADLLNGFGLPTGIIADMCADDHYVGPFVAIFLAAYNREQARNLIEQMGEEDPQA